MKSDPNDSQSQRERCLREIAECERLLRLGHPDVEGLCLALSDWWAELRIIGGSEGPGADADQDPGAGGEPREASPAAE